MNTSNFVHITVLMGKFTYSSYEYNVSVIFPYCTVLYFMLYIVHVLQHVYCAVLIHTTIVHNTIYTYSTYVQYKILYTVKPLKRPRYCASSSDSRVLRLKECGGRKIKYLNWEYLRLCHLMNPGKSLYWLNIDFILTQDWFKSEKQWNAIGMRTEEQ